MYDFTSLTLHEMVRPTKEEEAIFSSQTGRDLISLLDDVQKNGCVTYPHIDGFLKLSVPFHDAVRMTAVHRHGLLKTTGNRIAPDTEFVNRTLGTAIENQRGKNFTAFNIVSTVVNPYGLFGVSMPFPVKWHMDHISERMKERGAGHALDTSSPLFRAHNATALAMLRLFEDKHPPGYHPFILPERKGVLVGHTVPLGDNYAKNRVIMMAITDMPKFGFAPYEWIPKMHMTVRTFLGPDEMTPSMHRMRNHLLPFYGGEKAKALDIEFETIIDTVIRPSFDTHPLAESYADTFIKLGDAMGNPDWKKAAHLPAHLRQHPGP